MKPRGFILVVVLWLLLALVFAASALAAWVSRTVDMAVDLALESDAVVDQFSSLETLKFLLVTHRLDVGGIYMGAQEFEAQNLPAGAGWTEEDVPLDGRPLQGMGEVVISLQDEAGLISLNRPDPASLDRILEVMGVDFMRRPGLITALVDFTEPEDRRRLPGATGFEYRRAGLQPPRHRFLLAPLELDRVMGWHELDFLEADHFARELFTVLSFGSINLNTAPEMVLRALAGLNETELESLIQFRRTQPIEHIELLRRQLGLNLDALAFRTVPTRVIRITLWSPHTERGARYHIRLTPQADAAAPWRIELAYPVYGSKPDQSGARRISHPLFAASADRVDAER